MSSRPANSGKQRSAQAAVIRPAFEQNGRAISPGRLSLGERRLLKRCEKIIVRGAAQFIQVGLALRQIRDQKLYREEFRTFEAYCLEKFSFGRAHGYRLIADVAAMLELQDLAPMGDKFPLNEGQARELARVPLEMRVPVMEMAAELAGGEELTAKIIREAAGQLGAVSGNKIMPEGGDDGIQTPAWLAEGIVRHFMPGGKCLDPCRGAGAFCKAMGPDCGWFEISQEKDFMDAQGHWNWIITNPPFSQITAFLEKSLQVSDNIVFVALVNAWFVRSRQNLIRSAGFGLVELLELPIPESWPKFGLTLAAGWCRRGWQGGIAHTRLDPATVKSNPD